MNKVVLITVCVAGTIALGAEPAAAQVDPFSNEARTEQLRQYREAKADFLQRIHDAYFSVGCGVFPSEGNILPLINTWAHELDALANQMIDTSVQGQMKAAAKEGMEAAKGQGACAYWHEHPARVVELRREAQLAIGGAF